MPTAPRCPQIPEELFAYYSQLIQNQVAEELATEMIKTIQRQIRPEHARQPDFVRQKIAEQIERHLPSSGPIVRTKTTGPHVVALIGPTGVGKTTTIAKLAANLKLREKRRVGLVTLDTYRIAAIDQLKNTRTSSVRRWPWSAPPRSCPPPCDPWATANSFSSTPRAEAPTTR